MDIFEFAMQMERDGEKFYREMAETCGDKGLATILTMMADAEVKHYQVLKEMKGDMDTSLTDSLLLDNVKNVFAEMREQKDFNLNLSQVELYEKARGIEKKNEEFYLEKAGEVKSIPHQKILKKIAEEEREHYNLLGHLIEFVKKPDKWVENAEWHNLESF